MREERREGEEKEGRVDSMGGGREGGAGRVDSGLGDGEASRKWAGPGDTDSAALVERLTNAMRAGRGGGGESADGATRRT